MNPFTANALLKLLEEPQRIPRCCWSHRSRDALLPTIRSRCQQWAVARPAAQIAAAWLKAPGVPDAQTLLDLSGGHRSQRNAWPGRALMAPEAFHCRPGALPGADPIKLAGQWESWIKSRTRSPVASIR